jgi:hypothetical protein
MKKIIILFAILLIGAGNLSAQSAYTVDANWDYAPPFYCQSELTSNYVFVVTLNIYDVVNGVEVANISHIVSWTGTTTTFDGDDTNVQAWCDEASKTPNLRVKVTVRMVNTSTLEVYCDEDYTEYRTCNQFMGSGIAFYFLFH